MPLPRTTGKYPPLTVNFDGQGAAARFPRNLERELKAFNKRVLLLRLFAQLKTRYLLVIMSHNSGATIPTCCCTGARS